MNPVIGHCPICGESLAVTQLHCRHCDTTVQGHFALGRLYHLNPEQLRFVETFIRCEGKINRVEQEMGLSYPAMQLGYLPPANTTSTAYLVTGSSWPKSRWLYTPLSD